MCDVSCGTLEVAVGSYFKVQMCDVSCGTMEVAVESYFKCVMCPVVQITFKLSSTEYQLNDNS